DHDAAEHGTDIWIHDLDTGETRPLVADAGDQWDACWGPDGTSVYYVSDESGTRDLMRFSLRDGESERLTALVGGADSPTVARNGERLLFTAFDKGSWGLVLVEKPGEMKTCRAEPVTFWERPWDGHTPPEEEPADDVADDATDDVIVVADASGDGTTDAPATDAPATDAPATDEPSVGDELAAATITDEPSDPYETDYRPRFRSEWINGAFFYDGFGASAALSTSIADILGNHRVDLGANLFRDVTNTDASLRYSYLARRVDWSAGVFHVKDFYVADRTTLGQPLGEEGEDSYFSERRWGGLISASYPLHTFRRVGVDLTALEVRREILDQVDGTEPLPELTQGRLLLPRVHHSTDNTLWGWTGPVQGRRSIMSFEHSVPLSGERLSYGTAVGDWRQYWRTGEYVVAVRGFAAWSFGKDPQQFQLGGPNTIRGYERQQFRGRHAALVTAEFRYPFLEYVKLGWPFRSAFGGIRGDLFVDVGAAFDEAEDFRAFGRPPGDRAGLQDLRVGFGVGARARIAYLPLRIDVGWPTTLSRVGEPVWHFTIAPEF
ncbi:MAG: BamA/TamA family outer membrane protein, partial [Gemmatimonadetes bacterium]|nr:BamA/TamA family outer membrane protein [Gemmatimonadota bacterium]